MSQTNIDMYAVKKIEIEKARKISENLGWVRHIIIYRKDGTSSDITLFGDNASDLSI